MNKNTLTFAAVLALLWFFLSKPKAAVAGRAPLAGVGFGGPGGGSAPGVASASRVVRTNAPAANNNGLLAGLLAALAGLGGKQSKGGGGGSSGGGGSRGGRSTPAPPYNAITPDAAAREGGAGNFQSKFAQPATDTVSPYSSGAGEGGSSFDKGYGNTTLDSTDSLFGSAVSDNYSNLYNEGSNNYAVTEPVLSDNNVLPDPGSSAGDASLGSGDNSWGDWSGNPGSYDFGSGSDYLSTDNAPADFSTADSGLGGQFD